MRITRIGAALLGAGMMLAVAGGAARAATYNLAWTGSGGYSMTGSFSFSDSLLNTGPITGSSLTSLSITTFLGTVAQGSWSLASGVTPGANFNFNFDTTTGSLLVGGTSTTATGQQWNANNLGRGCGSTAGFISGDAGQGVCVGGAFKGFILISDSTLTATLATAAVPEPASIGLFGAALAGLGLWRRRRAPAAGAIAA